MFSYFFLKLSYHYNMFYFRKKTYFNEKESLNSEIGYNMAIPAKTIMF